MSLPASADPSRLSLDVLFPEQYEASKKEITRDFVLFGSAIVLGVVGSVLLAMRLSVLMA